MASLEAAQPTHSSTSSSNLVSSSTSQPFTSTAVEMSDLEASSGKKAGAGSQGGLLNDISIPTSSPLDSSFSTTIMQSEMQSSENTPSEGKKSAGSASKSGYDTTNDVLSSTNNAVTSAKPATISRLDSIAIGPSSSETPVPTTTNEAGPVLVITLLLTSGARHPYKIDEKYLTKRNVSVPELTASGKKDPFSISVYTLKELILREWREEWEAQPNSPSSIRLIYFGRLLDDKTALKDCRFNADSANVVHMTVRPQDIVDEEDASKGKALGRDRGDGEDTAGCRCIIQ